MFAEFEAAIIARLEAKLGDCVRGVYSLDALEDMPERRQQYPAVYVMYDGFTIESESGTTGNVVNAQQEWVVVCAAKSARGNGRNGEAKRLSSALAEQVLRALAGFHLGGGKYLKAGDAPGHEFDDGACYTPLAFSNRHTIRGDQP